MDVVFIEGLTVEAEIGVHAHERGRRQRLRFDIELACDTAAAVRSDSLADTIDYAAVARTVTELAEARAFQLVETLAENVARELLAQYPAASVRIRLRKPDAVARADAVGIEIERQRQA